MEGLALFHYLGISYMPLMQLVTPKVVPIAVRIATASWMTYFQISLFFIFQHLLSVLLMFLTNAAVTTALRCTASVVTTAL